MKRLTYSLVLVLIFALLLASQKIVINTSPSVPQGFYWRTAPTFQKGSLALICPPDTALFQKARERRIINAGLCSGNYGYLLKYIAGIRGDTIKIEDVGIKVNGQLLINSKKLKLGFEYDDVHSPIQLTSNEFWVMTTHKNSFDSRYFGVLDASAIVANLTPLWIWE